MPSGAVYKPPPNLSAGPVPPALITANRAGILKFCFIIHVFVDEEEDLEAKVMRRVEPGPLVAQVRKAGEHRYVLQPDGTYIDFFTVGAHFNTTSVHLCDDLRDSEKAGGPTADAVPGPDVQ